MNHPIHERIKGVGRQGRLSIGVFLILLLASPSFAESRKLTDIPGYVDGAPFIELVHDDAVTIEVNLHGALLKAITRIHPELAEVAGGLESIHGVVMTMEKKADVDRARELIRVTERRLKSAGWERLTRIRDVDAEVKVLVLNDEEAIHGLVVLVIGEDEVVFANIAGILDLAKISALGEELDLPGLDVLGE